MVEIINGVKNIKKLNIGQGLQSTPIINKGSRLQSTPVINKKGGNVKKRKIGKGLKILEKKYYYIIYNGRVKSNLSVIK